MSTPPTADELNRAEAHNAARKLLEEMGIHVTDIPAVHAKVAIIDDEIAWDGSLNILSQYRTEERMTRWRNKAKVAEIIKSHRLDCCNECMRPGFCITSEKDRKSFVQKQRIALGADIAARREQLSLSQRDLSDLSGVSQTFIAQIEKGGKEITLTTLSLLGRALETTFMPIPFHLGPSVNEQIRTRLKVRT
jgi:DNA-binding XRE family transcriptional regulator